MKVSARAGIGPGPYVLSLAVGVALYGTLTVLMQPGRVADAPRTTKDVGSGREDSEK
jgi:hypothetical protein